MKRAWCTLSIETKAAGDGKRTFTGIASTPATDRQGDIVEPKGAQFKLPIPLLWQHDSRQPIGWVTSAKVTAKGIEIAGEVAELDEQTAKDAPTLLQRLNEAWGMMKMGLVRGLSIGFKSIEEADIQGTWGRRFIKWDWLELSAVTIPANSEASILAIKSADELLLRTAAFGVPAQKSVIVRLNPPGASGQTQRQTPQPETKGINMTLKEAITQFQAKRKAAMDRMSEIVNKSVEEGVTLDAEQSTTHDELTAEVKAIDAHLARLYEQEKLVEAEVQDASTPGNTTSKAVVLSSRAGTDEVLSKSVRQGDGIIRANPLIPKGTAFVRYACALAMSKGVVMQAYQIAKKWDTSTPEVASVLKLALEAGGTTGFYGQDGAPITQHVKTAVAAGNTTDTNWASPLVQYNNMASEFVELLRPKTIIGRLQGLRRVPFNIRFASTTSGSSMAWVGQGLGKPVSKMQLSTNTLGFAKAAGIVVITKELAVLSSPAATELVQSDMLGAMAQFLDQQFINPNVAAVANVSPASITNGAGNIVQSTGATLALFEADLANLITGFVSNEIDIGSAVFICTPYTAMKIGMLRTTQGELAYPTINAAGGTLLGIPVLTTNAVPSSTSPGSILALVATPEIFLADEGGVELDASEEASLEMVDNPSGAAASLVSLWQNNLIGLRAERMINWQRRRTYAVGYIDNLHL